MTAIRVSGPETGWLYVLGKVSGAPVFINELILSDYSPFSVSNEVLHPISTEQYNSIYVTASYGLDPTALIQSILSDVLGGELHG